MKRASAWIIAAGFVWAAGASVCVAAPSALFAGFEPSPLHDADKAGVPDLEPWWPGEDSSDPRGRKRVLFPDGERGIIRVLEAPHGLVSGIQRGPTVAASMLAVFSPVVEEKIREVRLEGANSYGYRVARESERPRRSPAGVPNQSFEYVSASPRDVGDGEVDLEIQRTWFSVFEPAATVQTRGSVLLMPGLFGTPEPILNLLTAELRNEGWVVVRMMAQPSRFTEQMHWSIDLDNMDQNTPEIGMMSIIRETTDRAAECAFAARAAMRHVTSEYRELAELPRIAIGMSGGAMTLPTVVAIEPEKYTAAIMIAGGADFFTMNIESNYQQMINAVRFTWKPGHPDKQQIRDLSRVYLSQAPLDSYHTSLLLRGKPMLMIHGNFDLAVPAHLGDLLWDRLGRPERWAEDAGHEEVFMRLPQKVRPMITWLNLHLPALPE